MSGGGAGMLINKLKLKSFSIHFPTDSSSEDSLEASPAPSPEPSFYSHLSTYIRTMQNVNLENIDLYEDLDI